MALFGFPDILTGRFTIGLLKLGFEFFIFPFLFGIPYTLLIEADKSGLSGAVFYYSVLTLYFVCAGYDGYKIFSERLHVKNRPKL